MKKFCFTVDDNIRCFKEITESSPKSIFGHPYLSTYKRLHEKYGVKIQLNLFYETEGFNLSEMTDRYKAEWQESAEWLKLSFHSRRENSKPYESSGYDEVFRDCRDVHREIIRFASGSALAKTTTVHFCLATEEGISALRDNGVAGLLGLYGREGAPRSSYQSTPDEGDAIRRGEVVCRDGILYAGIDVILNLHSKEEILRRLYELSHRDFLKVMIHEQYFYSDYPRYQADFEEKLDKTFEYLTQSGFCSVFFEERLHACGGEINENIL